jgi:hypothetical protein
MPDNVTRPMFGPAAGFTMTPDGKCFLGLDEAETQELIELSREAAHGINPHHNPRYRELYAKYERALAATIGTKPEK